MGEATVKNVRIGKYIELVITENSSNKALLTAKRIIEKLLVNPVTESYSYEIEELDEVQ
jgi:phosphoribosylformylglycinamidine synthase